ncbi:MAG: hypothetical protein IJ180_01280 [Bacteroidales bacterium]|nr:hypothetical protein [Bacteroidales bacterium]
MLNEKQNIDGVGIINGTSTFLLAWLFVFYFFQVFTIFPAFFVGVSMVIYSYEVDFNSVNTSSADYNLWGSVDNIINIFGTPAIMLTILVLFSIIILSRLRPENIVMRRFLFWVILCGIVRLNGNYIAGSFFGSSHYVWNWNLVTDFLNITTNILFKCIFVALALLIIYITFHSMVYKVGVIFNPFGENKKQDMLSNILVPVFLGSVMLVIRYSYCINITEITCIVLMIVFSLVLYSLFIAKYKGTNNGNYSKEDESISFVPIIILLVVTIAGIIFDKYHFLVKESQYKRYFIENMVTLFVVVVLLVGFIILILHLRKNRRNYNKMMKINNENSIDLNEEVFSDFGVKNYDNLDKYNEMWKDSHDR